MTRDDENWTGSVMITITINITYINSITINITGVILLSHAMIIYANMYYANKKKFPVWMVGLINFVNGRIKK